MHRAQAHGNVDPEAFKGLCRAARSCGWWWPYEIGVVFYKRPAKATVNGRRVTMEFRDGWSCST
jgi:hypothetical protein